jgi:hypothetical protein
MLYVLHAFQFRANIVYVDQKVLTQCKVNVRLASVPERCLVLLIFGVLQYGVGGFSFQEHLQQHLQLCNAGKIVTMTNGDVDN